MIIKNTTKESINISTENGLILEPGKTMEVDGQMAEDALKIEGIEKDTGKKATPKKKKGKK